MTGLGGTDTGIATLDALVTLLLRGQRSCDAQREGQECRNPRMHPIGHYRGSPLPRGMRRQTRRSIGPPVIGAVGGVVQRWELFRSPERQHTGSGLSKQASCPTSPPRRTLPRPLASVLAGHAIRYPSAPADPVFPEGLGNYWKALKAWKATCRRAGITDCRLHDLRHTFGVHAARGGVPLARLQRLMGHASPSMTMRYMRHSPNRDFAADAALVAESMAVSGDREAEARATLVHSRLARA